MTLPISSLLFWNQKRNNTTSLFVPRSGIASSLSLSLSSNEARLLPVPTMRLTKALPHGFLVMLWILVSIFHFLIL